MFSLFILFLGVLMSTVPLHMQNLSSYILSRSHLGLSLSTQQTIISLLSHTFVIDAGRFLLGISSFLLLPSTLGYVGAVRESRLLLILVRNLAQGILLNNCIGTVPTFKMHHVGTVPMFKMHHIGLSLHLKSLT